MCAAGHDSQAGPGDGARLRERATELTRNLAAKTALNEGQYVKVRQLNLRLLTEMNEARKITNDAAAMDAAVADIQLRYEWDLATILRPRQMAVYDQTKQNMTALSTR